MKESIVQQLAHWLASQKSKLAASGIEFDDRIPESSSSIPWKATIGLLKDDILVSYTVWERSDFQTELIIVDGASGETVFSQDAAPKNADEIDKVLDSVVDDLIAGAYRH